MKKSHGLQKIKQMEQFLHTVKYDFLTNEYLTYCLPAQTNENGWAGCSSRVLTSPYRPQLLVLPYPNIPKKPAY